MDIKEICKIIKKEFPNHKNGLLTDVGENYMYTEIKAGPDFDSSAWLINKNDGQISDLDYMDYLKIPDHYFDDDPIHYETKDVLQEE